MKKLLAVCLILGGFYAKAQLKNDSSTVHRAFTPEKYFSFIPFGLAEPQIALGLGFGKRFSAKSEYFAELSYLCKYSVYGILVPSYIGGRFLAQYRYHLIHLHKPVTNLHHHKKIQWLNPFVGLEFRLKGSSFSDKHNFINTATNDTLKDVLYKANLVSVGGAIVFGHTFNIGNNGNWQLECTWGFGLKQKFVHITNRPVGYFPEIIYKTDPGIPYISQAITTPYIPFTFRLRYNIR